MEHDGCVGCKHERKLENSKLCRLRRLYNMLRYKY